MEKFRNFSDSSSPTNIAQIQSKIENLPENYEEKLSEMNLLPSMPSSNCPVIVLNAT